MGDLISRSALIEVIVKSEPRCSEWWTPLSDFMDGVQDRQDEIIDIVRKQPSINPTKNIVSQLNELREACLEDFHIYGIGEDLGMAKAYKKAIDIVRMCGREQT